MDIDDDAIVDPVVHVKAADEFIAKEDKEEGRVTKQVYQELFNRAGSSSMVLLGLSLAISFGFSVGNPLWLKAWSLNDDERQSTTFLAVYIFLGLMDSFSTGTVCLCKSLLINN